MREIDIGMAWRTCGIGRRHRENMVDVPAGEWGNMLARLAPLLGRGCLIGLCGNRGTGKTQMAAHMIKVRLDGYTPDEITGIGGPPRYCRAMEIFLDVRAAFKTAATVSEREAIRGYISPCLLVIDEMQERGETPFEDRLLTYIIEVRYAELRDTVLISNQVPEEFTRQIGKSAEDRMRETGGFVECKWTSFRAKHGVAA
jgi:DNA replication protein DnaC